MDKMPFTVLMSVYRSDDPNLFNEAIDSVFHNSIRPDEMVLVVDGPVPAEIEAVIERANSTWPEFKVLPLKQNVGLANALNAGLRECSHELIFRADADDINRKYRFEVQLKSFGREIDIMGGAILEVDKDASPIAKKVPPVTEQEIRKFARSRNPFNHMTVLFRKNVVLSHGGYPDIHLREDYALWALMLSGGARAMNLEDVLVEATTGRDMYKRRGGVKYAWAEIEFQRHLIKCGLKGVLGAFFTGAARAGVFLLPSFVRGFIYENYLRTSKE